MAIELTELSNEELQAILDEPSGKGRTAVYPPAITEIRTMAEGRDKVFALTFKWSDVNADAKPSEDGSKSERDVVVAGLKSTVSRLKYQGLTFKPNNVDADAINVVVNPTKVNAK